MFVFYVLHLKWFILLHFRYKIVELFFYLAMGFSPALVVTSMVRNVIVDITNIQTFFL